MARAQSVTRPLNWVTGQIVDAAMRVHSSVGPGLLESAYQACLAYELIKRGVVVGVQVPMPLRYGGIVLELAYRADLLVDGRVIVEIKATAALLPVHRAQLLSYLRASALPVGLLINFHALHLRDGIVRIANEIGTGSEVQSSAHSQ